MPLLSGWSNVIKFTVDNTKIDEWLTGFPVLIKLSDSSGIDLTDVTAVFTELGSDANRKRIAVTTADGITQCYVEIERWDTINEEAWLWVNVPSVLAETDTELYFYYDPTQADNTTYVGDIGEVAAQGVWDSSFKLVMHMAQEVNGGATDAIKDSTSNTNHGTFVGVGKNIALNKTCSKSYTGGHAASRAVDGNINTYAFCNTYPNTWWKVDLGASYTINAIYISKLQPYYGYCPKTYYIQTADDYDFTTNVVDIISEVDQTECDIMWGTSDFGVVNARYIRLYSHTESQYIYLAEFRVYIHEDGGLVDGKSGKALNFNGLVGFSVTKFNDETMDHLCFDGSSTCSNLSNGSSGAYWQTFMSVGNNWSRVDLGIGNEKYLNCVKLQALPNYPDRMANSFKIFGSNNDADWTEVFSGNALKNDSLQLFILSTKVGPYRYYRCSVYSNHGHVYLCLSQIQYLDSYYSLTDHVVCGSDVSLDDISTKTVEAIIKFDNFGESNAGRVLQKANVDTDGWQVLLNGANGKQLLEFRQDWDNGTLAKWQTSPYTLTTNTWYDLAMVYDNRSTDNNPLIYLGSESMRVNKITAPVGTCDSDAVNGLYIGVRRGDNMDNPYDGLIDEVRISNIKRSPAWLKATHYSNWDTLISFDTDPCIPACCYNTWTNDPFIYKSTVSGVNIYDLGTGSLLSFIEHNNTSSVWANNTHLYVATSVSGIYRCGVTAPFTLAPYKQYPDITNNYVYCIHGSGNYLCATTLSGVDHYNLTTGSGIYTCLYDVSKCFQTARGEFYYTYNPMGYDNELHVVYNNTNNWNMGTVGHAYEMGSYEINDLHITEKTSRYNDGNVIFLATSNGAIVIEEKPGDEENNNFKYYRIVT